MFPAWSNPLYTGFFTAASLKGAEAWPGRQRSWNCGLQSSAQIIAQVDGKPPDEKALMDKAIQDGYAAQGATDAATAGTNASSRQELLESYGIDSTIEPTSAQALGDAPSEGKSVIATVNADILWDEPQAYDQSAQNHAVLVYAGEYNKERKVTVPISTIPGPVNRVEE